MIWSQSAAAPEPELEVLPEITGVRLQGPQVFKDRDQPVLSTQKSILNPPGHQKYQNL